MKLPRHKYSESRANSARRGSVLIMVIWVIFGLIAITIYFANAMTSEIRAADNRAAGMEADQAIEGARRYISCVLSNLNSPGEVPDPRAYQCEAVPVGQAKFWLIGRTNVETLVATSPAFATLLPKTPPSAKASASVPPVPTVTGVAEAMEPLTSLPIRRVPWSTLVDPV